MIKKYLRDFQNALFGKIQCVVTCPTCLKKTFVKPVLEEYCFESALLCQRNRSCVALKNTSRKTLCLHFMTRWLNVHLIRWQKLHLWWAFSLSASGVKWRRARNGVREKRRKRGGENFFRPLYPPISLFFFPHYCDCGRRRRHLTNLKDLPPNLNSVSMTSLSVAVMLCPSERQSSVICFWFILPLPDLSYTENASLNSDKKNCIHLSTLLLTRALGRVGVSFLKLFRIFRPRFLTV